MSDNPDGCVGVVIYTGLIIVAAFMMAVLCGSFIMLTLITGP